MARVDQEWIARQGEVMRRFATLGLMISSRALQACMSNKTR